MSAALQKKEAAELGRLEEKVEGFRRSCFEAGLALEEIRERKLYRLSHATFDDYCKERWGMSSRHVYHLVDAAKIMLDIKSSKLRTTVRILPQTEWQIRPLARLTSEQRCEVWNAAITETDGEQPTADLLREMVEELEENIITFPEDNDPGAIEQAEEELKEENEAREEESAEKEKVSMLQRIREKAEQMIRLIDRYGLRHDSRTALGWKVSLTRLAEKIKQAGPRPVETDSGP